MSSKKMNFELNIPDEIRRDVYHYLNWELEEALQFSEVKRC